VKIRAGYDIAQCPYAVPMLLMLTISRDGSDQSMQFSPAVDARDYFNPYGRPDPVASVRPARCSAGPACKSGKDRKDRNKASSTRLARTGGGIVMTRLDPLILIVEDEFLLRLDYAETIESAGFEVIHGANADEAIAILKARLDIHVVFTDIKCRDRWTG
jgi:hypothetical protein